MTRPQYTQVDFEDREAYLGSRQGILGKSFVTDLWMKVVHRAIDDIVLFRIIKENNKELKEDELYDEKSAYDFLFNDDYRIPLDDYLVNVDCVECKANFDFAMSLFSSNESECPSCNKKVNSIITTYTITNNQTIKDINLRELLSLWGIEDIKGFREGTLERIEELVEKKKEIASKREKLKKGK